MTQDIFIGDSLPNNGAGTAPVESNLPTGLVTLVFTDIEGSSALWEAHGAAFSPVLSEHNRILREVSAEHGGVEVKTEGDAFFLSFADAAKAVRFAIEAQRAIAARDWSQVLSGLSELRVRIGMHSGAPIVERHPGGAWDYFGPVVNRAARVGGAGHGAQTIVSNATWQLSQAELPSEITGENLGRHRLKGVGEEILWQVNFPGLPARFPALKTLSGAKHNLPASTTAFIGRENEVAEWSGWLREEKSRLVTLLGFGGHGKTRLALQMAELLAEEFADGVWWIELEEARDAETMLARIAHELRLHLAPQPTLREQVLEFHRDRQMLLVLDNLEQIPDAARVVGDILRDAPNVKVLVTSRRALELRQERVAEVAPLPPSEAAQLFIERARSRVPHFQSTPENARAIEELCRRLEGVPLAIELAASRIAVLSPAEMLARLAEQFKLLQTRAPDLPPRQRALRGAIDWSHDLLGDEDKALFAALSVFAGGFTLEAVEAVCDEFDVLEGVAELRRHSLLRAEESNGATRFSMLESVRAYAMEKLQESRAEQEVRQKHAAYFSRYALERADALRTRREAAAVEEFFEERANIRAALEWSFSVQSPESTAHFVAGMHKLLHRLGFWDEARRALESGLAIAGPTTSMDELRAALQLGLASLAHDTGNPQAQTMAETALSAFGALNDASGRAAALNLLGLLASDRSDAASARQFFEESLQLRAISDHNGRAIALHNLALLAAGQGDKIGARRLYEETLVQRRAGGDMRGEAHTLGNLGALAFTDGDIKGARQLYLQSLDLCQSLRDRFGMAQMLFNLAEVAEHDADWPRSVTLYTHAGRLFHDLGSPHERAPQESLARLKSQIEEFAALGENSQNESWEDAIAAWKSS